jgi:hypothetical protein
MRRSLLLLVAGLTLAGVAADPPPSPKEAPGPLKAGANLPGPFLPYNVTGPYRGRLHDLVSQYNLDPVVLIIARGPDLNDAVRGLLTQLEGLIAANPKVSLRVFVVFVSDDLPEVVGTSPESDDRREEMAAKLDDLARGLKLDHVVLSLDGRADVEKYLSGDKAVTVVLYRNLKVVDSWPLDRNQLTDATVKQLLAEITAKTGAKPPKGG